jgi:hypothetical protein
MDSRIMPLCIKTKTKENNLAIKISNYTDKYKIYVIWMRMAHLDA